MPLTPLETELRGRARELIEQGRLPQLIPLRMWGGKGSGQPCDLCAQAIPPEEVEYEIEDHTQPRDPPSLYRFHFLCHAAWQFECARAVHLNTVSAQSGAPAERPGHRARGAEGGSPSMSTPGVNTAADLMGGTPVFPGTVHEAD